MNYADLQLFRGDRPMRFWNSQQGAHEDARAMRRRPLPLEDATACLRSSQDKRFGPQKARDRSAFHLRHTDGHSLAT